MTTKKWILILTGVGILGLGYFIYSQGTPSSSSSSQDSSSDKPIVATDSATINPDSLPGIQTGQISWVAEIDHLKARLDAIGLPALSAEGTVLHIHQHIDIYIDGQHFIVPAGVGINETDQFISPIHTHDSTGIIHVESPVKQTFYLGQFFDIWGVKFTNMCIGGYYNQDDKKLQVFVNGKEYMGNLRDLALSAHQEIVVTYGTSTELPSPIPSNYTFPLGD